MKGSNLVAHLDPLNKFASVVARRGVQALIESMGIIPMFIAEADEQDPETAKETLQLMNDAYGFGFGEPTVLNKGKEGKVSLEGAYSYPGDPDLYPIAAFKLKYVTVYVYPNALVVADDGTTQLLTRMD